MLLSVAGCGADGGGVDASIDLAADFAGSADAGSPTYAGTVSASVINGSSGASAFFAEYSSQQPQPMTQATVGPCAIRVTMSGGSAMVPMQRRAGTLTISSGTTTVTLTPTMPTMFSLYTAYSSPSKLWNGGETLTITAAGGEVLPFTATAVAPGAITYTLPAPVPVGTTVTLDRSKDFPVAWSGGTGGEVSVEFGVYNVSSAAAHLQVDCRFAATAGNGTVPSAALLMLPANRNGYYDIRGSGMKTISSGAYIINLAIAAYTLPANTATGAMILTQ